MDVPYMLAFISPDYIDAQATNYASRHGAVGVGKIGNVIGSPNVILIKDLQETAAQGYELLLRDEYACEFFATELNELLKEGPSDVLILPGQYDIQDVLSVLATHRADVHIDWSNTSSSIDKLNSLNRRAATLFSSTSSKFFMEDSSQDPAKLMSALITTHADAVILKENRGGARFENARGQSYVVGAQLREVAHSVGVGDCFDGAYVALVKQVGPEAALCYASWIAAEYAATTYPDDFRAAVQQCQSIPSYEIVQIPGVRLSWEERSQVHIYLAAPDFDYIDTKTIEHVESALKYHNFRPHRPVQEHGQANSNFTIAERRALCSQDIDLLYRCQVLIAIVDYDDPGTLVELGFAAAIGIPTLLLDPQETAQNPMVIGIPTVICHSVDELLVHVFRICGRTEAIHEQT
jgi:hypothetical protein